MLTPVSLAEIVLIVLTVKMDNTLVPSTADEIEQTISALVSPFWKKELRILRDR